nr:macrophage mannose receptor 1-like isoform X2 [Zootoca vivipara]
MSSFLLLNLLLLIQPAFQVSDSDSFLIYNENLKLCIQPQKSGSIIVDNCDEDNEGQHFKWVSDDQILNMAVKLCLAVPSKSNLAALTLSPCNETTELQKWECRNESLLTVKQEDLFLNPESGSPSRVMLSKAAISTWKIYGTKDSLCSKGYEALYTLRGNAFGAPCVFPFKYQNKWHAQCIRKDDKHGQLWCGTTADVDRDSLHGYCPVKDDRDELFWTRNQWTGDLYQINYLSVLTWYQARKSCQQQNAELLTITDIQEQAYLTGLINDMSNYYWIGLNALDLDNGWQWIGNHPFRYLNWSPGSPSPETEKICGSMQSTNGKWQNEKCQQKLGYICKKGNSSLDVSLIPTDGLKPIKCPDGWAAYAGHCYRLNRDPKTWKGALLSCRRERGDLLSIHNTMEYSFVISQLGYQPTDLLWIGLNDQKTPMYYEWSDGSTVRFTKWQKGKPTQMNGVQSDCVIMNGERGYWADNYCEEELGYICKREPLAFLSEEAETANLGCQKGWKRHGSYCYLIGQTPATFSEAQAFCETNKGSLTSVENRYEQAYLTSLVGFRSEKYFWIGLSDVKQPGTFNWTNGDSVLLTHWNAEMPGQLSGCVAMRTGTAAGLWDVVNCEEKAPFICKQWAEIVTTPPAPTTVPLPLCPEGWHPSKSRSVCFKGYNKDIRDKKTWFEAEEFCRAIGGNLVSAHNKEEHQLLKRICDSLCWIGLNELEPDKGFLWTDGSPLDYQEYFGHNAYKDKDCRGVILYYSWWKPEWCDNYHDWVCQIKRGVPLKPEPSNDFAYPFQVTEDGWIAFSGMEYYFSNASLSAGRAQRFCKKHAGDLAVVESESERKFLWKYDITFRTEGNPFIGLILGPDRKFGWVDRTPVTYVAWAPYEPNFADDVENCVVMYHKSGLWNDLNCEIESRFICERRNSSVPSTVAPTTPEPLGGCPQGWDFFGNKCFQLFGLHEEERKNWSAAQAACQDLGGNLASIPNKVVQAFLTLHLKSASTDPWIGLSNTFSQGAFVWKDKSDVYYTNWAKGFPLGNYGKTVCVFMMKEPEREAGNWRSGNCYSKKSYICQRNIDLALSRSETMIPVSGYTLFENSSYSLAGPKMTWEEARKKCNSEQAELASIWNPYIQSFVWLQVLKYREPMWIGLNTKMTGEQYKWTNNRRVTYTNWAPEEPKQKIACVYLDLDGHWKTGTCNETFFSVCERHHGDIPAEAPQRLGECPSSKGYAKDWIPFQTHCYQFYPVSKTWSAAFIRCAQLGGTLTSIEDLAEQEFLVEHTQQFGQRGFWIGLFMNIDGEWVWEDNTALGFINWKGEEPIFDPEYEFMGPSSGLPDYWNHCIFMYGDSGEWIKGDCQHSRGFICKTNKVFEEASGGPTSSTEQDDVPASPHGRLMVVVLPTLFIAIAVGVAVYIFYKRIHRQPRTVAAVETLLHQDSTIISQNQYSEFIAEKQEGD